jgi:hypothetical protein
MKFVPQTLPVRYQDHSDDPIFEARLYERHLGRSPLPPYPGAITDRWGT